MTQVDSDITAGLPPQIHHETLPPAADISAVEFTPLTGVLEEASTASLEMLKDVSIEISVELGRAQMTVRDILDLKLGSVVELEKLAGEAGDVYVNGTLIGRGEIVVVDDRFGIRIFEVVPNAKLTPRRH